MEAATEHKLDRSFVRRSLRSRRKIDRHKTSEFIRLVAMSASEMPLLRFCGP